MMIKPVTIEKEKKDWLKRCLTCKYYYTKQDDAETVYCRARTPGCNYKPAEEKKGGRKR